jgi:hypothetical protein
MHHHARRAPGGGNPKPQRNLPAARKLGCFSSTPELPTSQPANGRTIELIGGSHVAIDATGQLIGRFATLKAAVASFGGGPQ